jgi:drug/metabolite transporter (DMT)-like permease
VPLSAFALALAAAALHAGWNLLLARARDPTAAAAVALLLGVAALAPVAALRWRVEAEVWPYVAVSAAFEIAYFLLLAHAYQRGSMSVVYPVARGAAPVLVLALGVVALGDPASTEAVLGVLLVAGGVLLVRGLRNGDVRGLVGGLATAGAIAGYTLADARGIEHADPIVYLELILVAPALVIAGTVAARRGAGVLLAELRPETALIAIGTQGAYLLVLLALRLADAAPVAAVRETSVVIGVGLAAAVLGEHVPRARLAGAALVAAGVALVTIG